MIKKSNVNTIDYSSTINKGNDYSERWNSQLVEQYLEDIENGIKVKKSPYWEGNVNYKKGNLVFDFSKEELTEYYKCATDIIYFTEKYAKVMTDDGVTNIKLRDYQKPILQAFTDSNHRYHILKASR